MLALHHPCYLVLPCHHLCLFGSSSPSSVRATWSFPVIIRACLVLPRRLQCLLGFSPSLPLLHWFFPFVNLCLIGQKCVFSLLVIRLYIKSIKGLPFIVMHIFNLFSISLLFPHKNLNLAAQFLGTVKNGRVSGGLFTPLFFFLSMFVH